MRLRYKTAVLLTLPLLAAGCGDDLEDRNAALGLDAGAGQRVTVEAPRTDANENRPTGDESAALSADEDSEEEQPEGFALDDSDDEDVTLVDASPEELIIETDGFAAEPMDDAQGFAPEPMVPEPFSPNPVSRSPAPNE